MAYVQEIDVMHIVVYCLLDVHWYQIIAYQTNVEVCQLFIYCHSV